MVIFALAACGPSDLGVGEDCTEHGDCASGFCNLDPDGEGQCDINDFGAPCRTDDDCADRCLGAAASSAEPSGYCTHRCDNVQDCTAATGYVCSSLGPGSPAICRQE